MTGAGLEDAVFTTPDGAEIAYRLRRGRDPIVLIHALGCDATMWDGVVAALPVEAGLLIPELRGHGGSTLGWRPPSVDLWAEDIAGLVRSRRIEAPAIVGISMGGYTALAIAARQPQLARAYGLLDTTAAPDDDAGRQRRASGIALIRRAGWRAYADSLMPSLLNQNRPQFPANREHLLAMFRRAGDSGLPPTLQALADRPDRRAMLGTIAAPTIVIAGAADTLIPSERSRLLATGIAGARLHVFEEIAHMSAMEAPRRVASLLGSL